MGHHTSQYFPLRGHTSQRDLRPHCAPHPFWLAMSILTYNEMETIFGLEQVGFFFFLQGGTVLIVCES